MRALLSVLCLLVLSGATGCTDDLAPARPRYPGTLEPVGPPPDLSCEASAPPVPEPLIWKRVAPLAADLATALALPADALCLELGVLPCTDVHRVPLGGSDPIGTGLYTPPPRPLATSPLALDRLLLAACAERVTRDLAGPAVVFTNVDLSLPLLDPSSAPSSDRAAMEADGRVLYQRLLMRDATDAELSILIDLAGPDASGTPTAREWATLSCFAVGTTTEAIFL